MKVPCSDCSGPSRRAVLALPPAAALLAACGGSPDAGPQASSAPGDPVVTELAALREQGALGFRTRDDAKAIAVARGQDVVAYSSVCPHNGCTVGWDAETEQLVCPCHGSRFAPDDGAVVQGPARTGLEAVPVEVDESAGVLKRG